MIYGLYTLGLGVAVAGYAPAAFARRISRGVPLNLRARLGRGDEAIAAEPTGWIHAVSVGEAIAAAALIDGIHRLRPALPLTVTTVTETGARVARERYAAIARHRYFPLDFPGTVRRVVDAVRPAFLVCMETELWPNLFRLLGARGVPIMIANGRLSDRSFARYRLAGGLMRRVLAPVTVFAMQSSEDARRIIALGAPPERVSVTGNLKSEALADPAGSDGLWQRLLALGPDQLVWIAGSTHHGEDEAVLDAHRQVSARFPGLVLVLVPRHPERVPEVLALVGQHGFAAVRRSELPGRRQPGAVVVVDTVGELAQMYAVADVVFVGGSLVDAGGHNMLEPALRRKPVLFGPHVANFREAAALVEESGGGIVVPDAAALGRELGALLADPPRRAKLGEAAYAAVAARHGAVRETLALVERYLLPGGPPR